MIHLVNMPFASVHHPSLSLGLIKALLGQAGIPARVHDLNLTFARMIGVAGYEAIGLFKGKDVQVSEWLFAEHAWEERFGPSEEAFLDLCQRRLPEIPKVPDSREWFRRIRRRGVPAFLARATRMLAAEGAPAVVGFSCSFFQTISSLALGRYLKAAFPEIRLVYGGASFHGEMGEELMEKISWIDAVSTGEADDVCVPLFEALLAGKKPEGLQGILYRDDGGLVRADAPARPVSRAVLESLPHPDFDDYFHRIEEEGILGAPGWNEAMYLLFEGSRGCWWGQKHHCRFCGLNGETMGYRAKSAQRVYETLAEYVRRYPPCRYQAADNNLNMASFKTLFPMLKENPVGNNLRLYFEVKVGMTRPQVRALSEVGTTHLQPGIESLSTPLLSHMRKGTTALQNIYFLKLCREYGVSPMWNNLVRIPGETEQDYSDMVKLLPKLRHLSPPFSAAGSRPVECHRFSPYFCESQRWLTNLRPQAWYGALFPENRIDLSRVAYYFEADWNDTLPQENHGAVFAQTQEWNRIWRECAELPKLTFRAEDDGALTICDLRDAEGVTLNLDPVRAAVYKAIADPGEIVDIRRRIRGTGGGQISAEDIEEALAEFVGASLAVAEAGVFLGLALPETAMDPSLEERRKAYARN